MLAATKVDGAGDMEKKPMALAADTKFIERWCLDGVARLTVIKWAALTIVTRDRSKVNSLDDGDK